MAMGARPADVLKLIVGQGAWLVAAGVLLGLAGAFTVTRWMASLLFEVGTADPITFFGLALPLAVVAIAACYLPARQATRVDSMLSLRCE